MKGGGGGGGGGVGEWRVGGGITRKSWHMPSTESLPSTACARSSGEEGGGGCTNERKSVEMKLRRLSV